MAGQMNNQMMQQVIDAGNISLCLSSTNFQLHTTRSWDFMGLNAKSRCNGTAESDIMVGVLNTGIWPELDSFKGEGSSLPPKKWKGACEGGKNFTCNNKLIGAWFYKPADSARDEIGHGSHTASTATGNVVNDMSFYGIAQGVATGGAPAARIAAYKVCGDQGCPVEAILAAFDDAIADGVDIITVSLGPYGPMPLQKDPIAIGAFHTSQKGILTTQSAGNFGLTAGSVMSVAPWLLSVAASTTDRRIIDKVVLGDGRTFIGAQLSDKYSPKDHNYLSLAAVVPPIKAFTVKFRRVVKNVGLANSTYNAKMFTSSSQVDVKVVPEVLTFTSLNEEKPFEVTVVGRGLSNDSQPHVSALLLWSDGTHSVRSPILIHRKIE